MRAPDTPDMKVTVLFEETAKLPEFSTTNTSELISEYRRVDDNERTVTARAHRITITPNTTERRRAGIPVPPGAHIYITVAKGKTSHAQTPEIRKTTQH
jgi:hypothetical protein